MNRIALILFFVLSPILIMAQNPDGNYNPYVNDGVISPSPLLPLEANGTGNISFNIGNTGSDPLEIYTNQFITLTITLSYGVADNANPLAAIGGTAAGYFSWSYSSGTYTAIQTSTIPSNSAGTITINYKVTQNSTSPGSNGFNVNITPAPYQTTSNTQNDDAVSSYTYTEIRDFGDAPASYGSADHILDFANYLGSSVDGETANQPSSNADADDLNAQDDEDGVVFPAQIHRGETIIIPISVIGLGRLNAWIDWNGDGDFADASEQIASNLVRSDGTSNLSVLVPANAIITSPTFARFRFAPGTFSSSAGSVNGGEVEDYRILILCAPPAISLSSSDADGAFCASSNIIFTATGGINYNFRVDGNSMQNGALSTFSTSAITNGQVVDVIVTDANTCTATSSGISNIVHPLPVPTISSNDADNAFCAGTLVTFKATGGSSYDFRVGGLSVQNGPVDTFATNALLNTQIVSAIVTNSNGCIANTSGISNTVHALPLPSLSSSDIDNSFCAGSSITFTAGGGTDYNFRIAGVSVQNSASNVFISNAISDGQIVDVVVTNSNSCINFSTGITNTVLPLPIANAGLPLNAICQGGSTVPLGGSVSGSATAGSWSTTAGGTFSPSSSTLNATWIPPVAYSGTATLVLTTNGGSCGSITASKSQLVNPTPVVSITYPAPACFPATVDLTLGSVTQGSTSGLSFTYWTDLAGTIAFTTPTLATSGTYYIKGTVPSTGCYQIRPVAVTINPIPSTPVINVVNNCNSTSSLSTVATGSLLWSTGATTPGITVNTSGTYTLTTTINGCTSALSSAIATPKTSPTQPVVSTASPSNICPVQTINLVSLITSSTPSGGSILFKTTNDPLGTNVVNPSAVNAGNYYIFYQDIEGCFSNGTTVTTALNSCPPDITPTLIVNPNIMHGITNFNLTIRVSELNLINTTGPIVINVPKDSRWFLTDGYIPSLTILGSTTLNNSDWTYNSDATNHIFTSSTVIPAGGFSTFGFSVTFNPGSSRGIYSITSQVVSGGGGEIRVSNNADSEKLDYFQQ